MRKIILCILIAIIITTTFISCNINLPGMTNATQSDEDEAESTESDNSEVNKNEAAPEVKGLKYELNSDKKSYSVVGFGTMEDFKEYKAEYIVDTAEEILDLVK